MTSYPETNLSASFLNISESYQSHQPLSEVFPVKIGGVARHYLTANDSTEIIEAAKLAIANKIPYRTVGASTAVLVGESGFPGLIIVNQTKGIFPLHEHSQVRVETGTENRQFVNTMATANLGGVEFLSAIPGTIGGAIVTDAQALGKKISSFIKKLTIFEPDSQKIVTLEGGELKEQAFFGAFDEKLVYPPIILTATLQMSFLPQEEIIRRLRIVGTASRRNIVNVFGHLLREKLPPKSIDRTLQKNLKLFKVRYQPEDDLLFIYNGATPTNVKTAISELLAKAKELGIEQNERLTYLGYFDEQVVA